MQALRGVDFEVRAGEVMALVGDNGAGKSTLIKCVAGIHSIDSGEILFEGKPVSIHGPKDAAKLGIEVVYQDLALCDNLDVVQNMFLGREEHDALCRLREAADGAAHDRDAGVAVGDDDPLGAPAGRDALGRSAPVGRGRAGGVVELTASSSSTSRPRRSASRRRARCSTSSSGSASRASPS